VRTKVTFLVSWPAPLASRWGAAPLPLTVRTRDMAFVRSFFSTDSIELAPSEYWVGGRLPGGESLHAAVDLRNLREACIAIEICQCRRDSPASAVPSATGRVLVRWCSAPVDAGPPPFPMSHDSGEAVELSLQRPIDRFSVPSGHRAWIEVVEGAPPARIVAPAGPGDTAAAAFHVVSEGARVQPLVDNPTADLLLHYAHARMDEPARQLAHRLASEIDPERAPIAAAIVLYAFLRFDLVPPPSVEGWPERLAASSSEADGLAILSEVHARAGRHGDAAAALLRLPPEPVFLFPDGIRYALERLRVYARDVLSEDEEQAPLGPVERGRACAMLVVLERLAAEIELAEPIVAAPATAPAAREPPGGTPLDPALEDERRLAEVATRLDGISREHAALPAGTPLSQAHLDTVLEGMIVACSSAHRVPPQDVAFDRAVDCLSRCTALLGRTRESELLRLVAPPALARPSSIPDPEEFAAEDVAGLREMLRGVRTPAAAFAALRDSRACELSLGYLVCALGHPAEVAAIVRSAIALGGPAWAMAELRALAPSSLPEIHGLAAILARALSAATTLEIGTVVLPGSRTGRGQAFITLRDRATPVTLPDMMPASGDLVETLARTTPRSRPFAPVSTVSEFAARLPPDEESHAK